MNVRTVCLAMAIAAMLLVGPVYAQGEPWQSPQFKTCLDKANGIVPEIDDCSRDESERIFKEITERIAQIRRIAPKFAAPDIAKSQREWERFQYAHCDLIYDIWGGSETKADAGTDGRTYSLFCFVQTDVQRLAELDRILKFLRR